MERSEKLKLEKLLGEGSFGIVYQIVDVETNKKVWNAIKLEIAYHEDIFGYSIGQLVHCIFTSLWSDNSVTYSGRIKLLNLFCYDLWDLFSSKEHLVNW